MANHSISVFGPESNLWKLSDEEVSRQAIASLRGYIYQLHTSVAAWIRLPADGELHLEVAEDYAELLTPEGKSERALHAVQVKETRESGSITLNSEDVLKAIETLFSLQETNPGREVFMTFLTTSPIGKEIKDPLLSKVPALKQWSVAANGGDASELHEALKSRFQSGLLADYLRACSVQEFRARLLSRLTFACESAQSEQLEAEGREYLAKIRGEVQAEVTAAKRAYDAILGALIKKAVNPDSRKLDRKLFLDIFAEATATAIPSQLYVDLTAGVAHAVIKPQPEPKAENSLSTLMGLAQGLCDFGRPPSLLPLFPDACDAAYRALQHLSEVKRIVIDEQSSRENPVRFVLDGLLRQTERHHLIYATPGAGKSHMLHQLVLDLLSRWKEANTSKSDTPAAFMPVVPILLPVGGLKTAESVLSLIKNQNADIDFTLLLSDKRICILLDGWSEFATGDVSERTALLRALKGVRVIATARRPDESDAIFKLWALERLSPSEVHKVLGKAFAGTHSLGDQVIDLLRLPLLLSLYLLLGSAKTTRGELIEAFHQRVSKGLPEKFDDVLVDAVSNLSLRDERTFSRLSGTLRIAASKQNLSEPLSDLERLGTITQRGKVAVPIHDLYWSWLSGVGILRGQKLPHSIGSLKTRESLSLALESGEHIDPMLVEEAVTIDAVLAASFDAALRGPSTSRCLASELEAMFGHPHLAVRCRAAIAGLRAERAYFVRQALDVLDEAANAKQYIPELHETLDPKVLFTHRSELAAWMSVPRTADVMDVVAKKGNAEWLPWLEQMYRSGQISAHRALSTALACSNGIPSWGYEHLPSLISQHPWLLRSTSERGANRQLAIWIADNYPNGVRANFSIAWECNRVLLTCGDDEVYEQLLSHLPSLSKDSQEVLTMVVPQLGDRWVAEFQKVAFSKPDQQHFHQLLKETSLDIDDATARGWIDCGYYEQGWNVLVGRHGVAMLPELISQLPDAFGGHGVIPALGAIASIKELPESFLQELDKRMFYGGTSQEPLRPWVIERAIAAAAAVKPVGMGWLIRKCLDIPAMFTGYYGMRFLDHYDAWTRSTGMKAQVGDKTKAMPFDEWFISVYFVQSGEDELLPELLRNRPQMAIRLITQEFSKNDDKCEKILSRLKPLSAYDNALFERMIDSAILAPNIPKVFEEVFNQFPSKQLLRLVETPHVKSELLFYSLRNANETAFREAHLHLIKQLRFEPLNLHHVRNLASMLRKYDREQLIDLFTPMFVEDGTPGDDCVHWLLREVGHAKQELLIDERGRFLKY